MRLGNSAACWSSKNQRTSRILILILVPFQYATEIALAFMISEPPFVSVQYLILSHPPTFIRMALRFLKRKQYNDFGGHLCFHWDAIQFMFDHVDLFISCL